MRVWALVYDASHNPLGMVQRLMGASVTRMLDGAGSVSLVAPLTDERARELLTNERRVEIYVENEGTTRFLGRGIVTGVKSGIAAGGLGLSADGPDAFEEWKRIMVLPGLDATSNLFTHIFSLRPGGWTVSGSLDDTGSFTLVSNGASNLKRAQALIAENGVHMRLGDEPREMEVGVFGDLLNLRLLQPERNFQKLQRDEIAFISQLEVVEDSAEVVNWLLPLGKGDWPGVLDLTYSTRTTPYTIETSTHPILPDLSWKFLKDDTSISMYGQIERTVTFRDIGPADNSDAALEAAANRLYDAAVNWLQRHKDPLVSYRCTLKKVRTLVRPGDLLHLTYKGVVTKNGRPYTYVDIDEELWVLKATESVGVEGQTLTLELATIDRRPEAPERAVVAELERADTRDLSRQVYPVRNSWVNTRQINSTTPAVFPLQITNATTLLRRAQIWILTRTLLGSANYPLTLTLWVNGVNVSGTFGGGWAGTGGVDLGPFDITSLLNSAGLRQRHTVEVRCTSQDGNVDLIVELVEQVQANI